MTPPLVLAVKLDPRASEALAEDLRAARGRDVVLDGSSVEHLGAHAAQTLAVAAASWATDGKTLRIENLSDAAAEQLSVMGLSPARLQAGSPA